MPCRTWQRRHKENALFEGRSQIAFEGEPVISPMRQRRDRHQA
jgi:hypothetical protein